MKRSTLLVFFASLSLGNHAVDAGTVVFVKDDSLAGGDGQTWATAYQYVQDALAAAASSGGAITEIWVAAGVYKPDRNASNPDGTGDRTATFQLITGVALRGGFAGNEDSSTFNLANRDLSANKTTLSGDLANNDGLNFANNSDNSYHVVTANGTDGTAILVTLPPETSPGGMS